MSAPLSAAKQQLRNVMKRRLSVIPAESIAVQSLGGLSCRQIFETLKDYQPYIKAQKISVYLSMPSSEVQTDAIVRHALISGKQVFVPYLHKVQLDAPNTPARVMDMVHLRDIEDYEGLKMDRWGIPSIDPATVHGRQRILGESGALHSDVSGLDLMLLPGVAFDIDASGSIRRMGHGKGFYDFFMNRYWAKMSDSEDYTMRSTLFVGLALDEQFLSGAAEQVPIGPLDRKLDVLITGSGQIKESLQSTEPCREVLGEQIL